VPDLTLAGTTPSAGNLTRLLDASLWRPGHVRIAPPSQAGICLAPV